MRHIQVALRQCVARRCRSAAAYRSHCLVLTSKKESLELARQWKQHFVPSTPNTWLAYVRRMSATAIADNLSKAGWSWGCVSALDAQGRTIWITDAHRNDRKVLRCACG